MEHVLEIGRRERKRQAVRQGLLDAAAVLFAEQGINGTTVDDIAQAADVARQTVFNHFAYKEAFVLEIVAKRLSAAMASIVAETPTRSGDALRRDLKILFDIWLHGITERRH